MDYVEDFEDCTLTKADVNALICGIRMKCLRYTRLGEPVAARALEHVFTDVSLLVSAVQGRHACKKIAELCREASIESLMPQLRTVIRPEFIEQWVDTPNPEFGGETPRERVRRGGRADILAMIHRLQSGEPN